MTNEKLDIKKAIDTTALQTESLLRFMSQVGYDPLYKSSYYEDAHDTYYTGEILVGFRQPRFDRSGIGQVSVNTAILLHNEAGYDVFDSIKDTNLSLDQVMELKNNTASNNFSFLFAHTCRLVKKIKGCGSKTRGLVIHSNIVEFNSRADYRKYGKGLGL